MNSNTRHIATPLMSALLALASGWAQAQTQVADAWVRGTVAQQKSTGAFLTLTSAQGGKLLAVQSAVADLVEIHTMTMDGNVMKMHAVPAIELPAGQAVQLKPGGFHVMLMGLKQPIKDGDTVPLTLLIEGKDGKRETLQVSAPVRPLGAQPAEHKH